ncbi:hypothetical protein K470DRAFT_222262 [Piedraia hortae CBS 480.64]|uniref:Ribosomal RNA-processing protein 42 n=1 Tax=Piedraia hortae CBS 480.64 TaxID=1314780 RepID=A0A6A7BTF2_9PEZI|nr:hypothetical protein K470DRAFT_222262 [Piedraia hortae CBS 480.64]
MVAHAAVTLSPAELAYIHDSLAQQPPIRPDGRSPTQFRPLVAETDILPSANGSARVCFGDGTEAVVGVKAEVEREAEFPFAGPQPVGEDEWLEVAVNMPGQRDNDALSVFLGSMLTEALRADGKLVERLRINARFHWRLYVDILLLSAPSSYPLPLLSLTTHLALMATRIPALVSEGEEDALFNDDWEAATPLYPRPPKRHSKHASYRRPPVTLLVMSVGDNLFFDPSQEELAVADAVFAVSVMRESNNDKLRVVALRSVDPPSRSTTAGVSLATGQAAEAKQAGDGASWRPPPRGGIGRNLMLSLIEAVTEANGVGEEVLQGLADARGV